MPKLSDNDKLLGHRDNYSERPPEWYRQRLVVFVPHREDQSSRRSTDIDDALKTIVQVIEAPFVDRDSRIYAPMTHFVIRTQVAAPGNHDRRRIQTVIRNHSRDLGVAFEARVLETIVPDGRRSGFFTGSAVFVPQRESEIPRGSVSLYLYSPDEKDGSVIVSEWNVVFSSAGETAPAGIYLGQDRICFGCSPLLPAQIKLKRSFRLDADGKELPKGADLNTQDGVPEDQNVDFPDTTALLRQDAICLVLPPVANIAGGGASVFFTNICDQAKAVLSGEKLPTAGQPISLISESRDPREQWRDIPQKPIDPATGILELDVSGGILARETLHAGYRAILRLAPNSAYARLRASPDALLGGRLEVLGLLLPSPSGSKLVRESLVNFHSSSALLAHELQAHTLSMIIRPKPYPLSPQRDHVATADSDGEIWEDQIYLDDITETRVGRDHSVQLVSIRSRFDLSIKDQSLMEPLKAMQADLPGNSFAFLSHTNTTGNLGWVGIPLPHECREQDAYPHVPVTLSRSEQQAQQRQVCLDWLDIAAKVVVEDRRGKLDLLGYAEFWENTIQAQFGNIADKQFFSMRAVEGNKKALHYVETKRGEDNAVRLEHGTCIRIGPIVARYSQPEKEAAR
ncbi:hypothetical protein [Tropicibacter oceani]|uniref:Baseplate protein J-like domain-containing protein n=1 Tax=Tropicibacter oceani TaxID=3058420 RepID=A0ABY8QGM3_9RHOB|nr:hypothetical protein [Tropicibacter oceani]WGW03583.1 hypothetical protein QF118_16915 [Tropicibacter oceani]